jgi:hypothetical protein
MAKITSNAHLWLSEVGAPDPTPVVVTSITKASPAVCTPATMPVGLANDDVVLFSDTGAPYLDGRAFRIGALTSTTFTLVDVDSTDLTAAVSAGTFQPFMKTGATPPAMLSACMAQITVTGVAPDSINLDDMCSTMTLLGDPKPPTFTFSGFVDSDSEGFQNLVSASVTVPKPTVWALFDFSTPGGYIFGPVEIGEMTITAGVKAGLQFSGSGVFTILPTYSWVL